MKDKALSGKTAIVTGAAHGIGKAIAGLFAAEGASVLIADIDKQAGEAAATEFSGAGGKAEFRRTDVASRADVEQAVTLAAGWSGKIDVLVNNAAFIGQWHNAAEAPDEEWEKCVNISLMGTHYFTQSVLPYMRTQRNGSIIVISSIQGMVGARSSVAYTTIKSGLLGFARSVAYDFGPENIRCNAICPGPIRTRISPPDGSELHRRQVSKTFLGRTGEPIEVAHAALFLASDHSSYITGAVIPVDGGWTAM